MSSSTLSQSRTETRASQPPSRASCINWVRNGYCAYGEKCKYLHQTLRREYSNPSVVAVPRPRPSTTETSSPGKSSPQLRILHPPPPNKEICRNWQRRFCSRGYNCYYVHGDLKYDLPTQIRHPPPPHAGTCRQWLQDACSLGYNCHYVHGDLIYELPELEVSTPRAHHSPALPPEPPITIVIHEHTKVKIGPGFEIHELTTSVETPWVVLSHVPSRASTTLIERLLKPFGSALDIQLPPIRPKDVMTVKVRFDSSRGATAATALDGSTFLNTRISARVPVNSRSGLATIQDCSLRIEFEAPQRVAYGGYPSHERAQEAIAVAAKGQSGDYFVYATVHVGLPSIGNVTVKFTNLPPTANEDFMRRFATPEDVMWERPNYVDLKAAIAGITRILRNLGNFLELDVLPPPYSNGRIRVWASFSSATAAKSAAAALHGRKPLFVGKTRIFARHVLSLTYRVSFDDYYRDARLIEGLRESAYRKGALMSITIRRLQETMLVRLSAQGVKPLGWLKAEYEKISRGEILHRDGVPVWDFFFGRSDGQTYLRSLEAQEGVHVVADKIRRNMKLFGTPSNRAKVRTILLLKMTDLKTRQVRTIRVPGRVLGALIVTQLSHLYQKFGNGSISVNLTESTLMLLGGDELYEAAVDAVREAQQSPLAERPYVRNLAACPICFNEVVSPIYLACGHRWCRTCLNQYLLAVVDNRHFPLKCLGDEAKCTQIITLSTARTVLQPDEFNSIVEASVSSYVHAHAKEFHYCPSPDCMQIYRTGSKGTVVQCPSCLLRICSHCHAEAHDDLACAEQDGDKLFKEWAASHDVKNCPGCAIPIERDEGCHHVTCIQCQTHICWVCLQTFPKGEGIYRHMREEHGGIGLNDNE
ncbi:hypothetical protein R3P38DRAFT_1282339 [Favolaschia claudopus]|uniref:RBR-type E3 ubiquitin transferase n=1 Tax=Favolaschia claudopus TaxID=2862362 RepID=A0AAW0B1N0_9AGAR